MTNQTSLKSLDIADIARLVRSEIKVLQKSNMLPAGLITVKIQRYSMGCSLMVVCEALSVDVHNESRLWHEIANPKGYFDNEDYQSLPRFNEKGEQIQAVLEAVVAPYHRENTMYDGCNSNFAKTIVIGSSSQRATEISRLVNQGVSHV